MCGSMAVGLGRNLYPKDSDVICVRHWAFGNLS